MSDVLEPTCAGCSEVDEQELMIRLDEVLEEYKSNPGGLIPVLQIAQGLFGYLPEHVLRKIAKGLDKPYSEVAGVVGFYSFFSTQPRGKNVIRVCLGTACYVRGGKQILDALKKKLKIDVGETTEDQQFSLEVGRCFGACGLAPVVMVNDDTHQRVKASKAGELIAAYKTEEEDA
ncbi:MAG: NAD(P)H-dependent oxidoreductase subunit E [Kiritimatiellales bacterium]|nr:NAD(P)H-dependent oxidoreductase subunit E [Kiritimatiellales bacterium]